MTTTPTFHQLIQAIHTTDAAALEATGSTDPSRLPKALAAVHVAERELLEAIRTRQNSVPKGVAEFEHLLAEIQNMAPHAWVLVLLDNPDSVSVVHVHSLLGPASLGELLAKVAETYRTNTFIGDGAPSKERPS